MIFNVLHVLYIHIPILSISTPIHIAHTKILIILYIYMELSLMFIYTQFSSSLFTFLWIAQRIHTVLMF